MYLVYLDDVLGLGPLYSVVDIKLDLLSGLEGFVPFGSDSRVMDEKLAPFTSFDEAKSFGVVEPLHFAYSHEADSSLNTSDRAGVGIV
jgi:hypothetical protein